MTPEALGPFVLRPVPIWACHPNTIGGWLTSFHPSLVVLTLVCVHVEDHPLVVPLIPLHPPLPLLSHLQTVPHLQAEFM